MGPLTSLRRHGVTGLASILFLGFVATGSFNFFKHAAPLPYTDLKVVIENPVIEKGEPLVVNVSGTRNRLCAVTLARAFIDQRTNRMVYQDIVPVGFGGLGQFSRPFEIRLPPFIGAGDYLFKGIQINDCGSEVYPIPYPEAVFSVISHY